MRRLAVLKNERASWIAHWRDLTDHVMPWSGRFIQTDRNRGTKRTWAIINGAATVALRTLVSGMMSGMTSPARPWFKLTTHDPDLAESDSVREWLEHVEQRLRAGFAQSNLYDVLPQMYSSLALYGTSPVVMESDVEDVIRFYAVPVGQYMLAQSSRLKIDTLYREFSMTVGQVVEQFGLDTASAYVKNAYARGNYDWWVYVCHAIEPNRGRVAERKDYRGMSWRSGWFETGMAGQTGANAEGNGYSGEQLGLLGNSGFREFPCIAPRWDRTADDIYGYCPGMLALGDTRALQLLERRKAMVVDKIVNPPMVGPSSMRALRQSILPGDMNYVDAIQGGQKFEPAMVVNPNALEAVENSIDKHVGRIDEYFYANLWLAILRQGDSDPQRTATEITEQHEEKLLQLGPVVEKVHGEGLQPLIERMFNEMWRRGELPPPPDELQGQSVRIVFVSIMAQAQKMLGLTSLQTVRDFTISLAQIRPDAADSLNVDAMIQEAADLAGVKSGMLLTADQLAQLRQQRAQQQQAAAAGQAIGVGAKAMKDASGADMSGDNGLTRALQALGGPASVAGAGSA